MKKKLQDLAAFMCESKINNFGKCRNYVAQRDVAEAMLWEYSYHGQDDFGSVIKMSNRAYLEFKIFFTLLVAEHKSYRA